MDFNLSSSYSKTPGINIQALGSQYKKTWRLGDLEVIISHYSAAISPIDKPTRSEMEQNLLHLVSLAHALDDRYKHTGDIEDVERRINVCNTALGSEACGSWRPSLLCLLASALRVRFQLFGRAADLQQALDLHEEALTAHHSPSLERAWMLSEFGLSRFTQYNQYGNFETLVGSISLQQESLEMRPKGSLYRYRSLYCLGHTLWTRFTVLGKKEDLEASIRLSSEALDLCPVGHRDRHLPLHSLGNAYYRLYCETDDVSHLFSATSHFREALELRTTEHRDMRPLTLTNLSWMLRTQAGIQREPHTLNQAITFAREAMSLCPKGHWKRRHVANDLAIVLTDRYRLQCNVPDLEEAIMLQREALQVALGELAGSVPGMKPKAKADPRRHLTLHNLANNMHLHFQVTNNAHEHKEALLIQQQALDLLHDGHSDRAYCLFGLARLHLTGSSAAEEITTIMQLFSDAVRDPHRSEQLRLTDAVDVLDIFERRLHIGGFPINSRRMALRVYRLTISLLPRVAIFRTRAKLRLQVLAKAEHLAAHAAAHALYLEDPEVAIEVLEEGRAMFWTQHLRLRTSFDALPIEISGPLRSAACKLESTWTSPQAPGSAGVFWDNARQLDEEFETLVREARNLPGFSRFMLHETYGALSEAAERGPVVILIPNLLICHAIIIPEPEKPPLHVKLNISKDCLSKLSRALRSSGRFRRDLSTEELVVRAVKISHTPLQAEVVLEELWQKVVQPVVNELKLKRATSSNRKRLWWCPTGIFAFLPMHAATSSLPDGHSCSDYIISSYTPTISALLSARRRHKEVSYAELRVLLAAVPKPFQGMPLNGVVTELQVIKKAIQSSGPEAVSGLRHDALSLIIDASADDVLQALPNISVLHLACHGEQAAHDALDSGFLMRDRRLHVSDLLKLNLGSAFLAFLSACETARGDDMQPDQAIHLAATMLFAGFQSVVGTMWTMHDADGPLVSSVFYRELFKSSHDNIDPDAVAYALDTAVLELRRQGRPPSRWAPFIHFGI